MKRGIKFRAFLNSKYYEKPCMLSWEELLEQYDAIDIFQRDLMTLMQYTGLKDKNGREIYENDLLQCTSYTYGNGETGKTSLLVKYDEMSAGFIAGPYMLGKLMDIRKCEVIGNIFENPELLEGKQ